MRKPIIAGNWKMHKTPSQTVSLINELKPLVKDAQVEVVVCPPFVCLPAAKEAVAGSNIKLGAQNMHWEEQGAFTGEVAPGMLKELGVEYVIIGHSERRQYFGETDEMVNQKVLSAVAHNLIPIICVGETLEQREQGITEEVVDRQTRAALKGLSPDVADRVVIAYEPIWAIGTGRTASSNDANEVIGYIRKVVGEVLGSQAAQQMRILYGGSVKPENAAELMQMPEIDGGLVGGASLKAQDFAKIVKY
ncbi:triose-phosphate isomerase [Caldicoprobacter algeriensis]|uniref:triose-phosphate isomerase n=1 Tax=Caldicoprobacter algeriensis TaxID=699281 RepID=UPI002079860C|nr:triose-phosphate isomerase [Caldicoprobacter algeriensis]MCM8901578.1 triose-phosphate isomerase [Caldicoprobacter algeriensis]